MSLLAWESRPHPQHVGKLDAGQKTLSLTALNVTNFFLADAAGVLGSFLATFLQQRHWRYDSIALATALGGLGTFLFQTPAGYFVDGTRKLRLWLIIASLVVGSAHGLLPLVPSRWWSVDPLMFVSGAAGALLPPLLAAIPLALVGYRRLNRVLGANQAWNHAGNIAAAATAMILVSRLSMSSVFYAVVVVSILAAASVLLVRRRDLDIGQASGLERHGAATAEQISMQRLLRSRTVLVLFVSTALFHFANAPVLPLVGMYLKSLGGSDRQVAATVLTAQTVMIPVAWLAGWLCNVWGRKPVFAIGFLMLPLRIFLYSLTHSASVLVALQCLDGIGAGIYGVLIVAVCADLTRGKGHFNALNGLMATALSLGGMIGPLVAGSIIQRLGFGPAFYALSGLAAIGAIAFVLLMPETKPNFAGTESTSPSLEAEWSNPAPGRRM
jgi:MFS family permease